MDLYKACSIIEGFCGYEPTEDEIIEAWQFIYDTKAYLHLQGFYGRTCRDLVEQGLIQ